jgi:hypothetical protein
MQLLTGRKPGRKNIGAQTPINGGCQRPRTTDLVVRKKVERKGFHLGLRLKIAGPIVNRKSIFDLVHATTITSSAL